MKFLVVVTPLSIYPLSFFSPLDFSVAFEFTLESKFILNCGSQQLSHDLRFQGNKRNKWKLDSLNNLTYCFCIVLNNDAVGPVDMLASFHEFVGNNPRESAIIDSIWEENVKKGDIQPVSRRFILTKIYFVRSNITQNFPKMIVRNLRVQVQTFWNTSKNLLFSIYFQLF